jgi:eukaryotic-like serine/threonine-protein kinase
MGAMQQQLGHDDRFQAVRRIDAGGMGEVWEADDTLLGRRVAIKVLAVELAGDPVAVRRFGREARATAMLDHPNVVRVFDFVDGEAPFLVLELLEGQTLAERLRGGALPPLEAARIGAEVADGLDAAHRIGIIHRDIKPGNIMLTAGGGVKVMDFGIAAAREAHSTTGQQLLATAAPAPPERIAGGRASPAGDLYSLGVVLYEMLTGRPPFMADTAERLLRAHLEAEPRPVRELVFWVPPEIAAACEAALAKDPAARPASAGALAARLRAAASAAQASEADFPLRTVGADRTAAADRPAAPTRRLWPDQTQAVEDPRRRPRRVGVAAALVVVLGVVAVAFWRANVDRPGTARPSAATARQAPAAQPASVTVTLRYRERVWTQCRVDGRLAFDGTGTPGERRSWTARRVDLVLGNPTGVELVVDGQVLGRPNGHGRLWRGTFQPDRPPPPLG